METNVDSIRINGIEDEFQSFEKPVEPLLELNQQNKTDEIEDEFQSFVDAVPASVAPKHSVSILKEVSFIRNHATASNMTIDAKVINTLLYRDISIIYYTLY